MEWTGQVYADIPTVSVSTYIDASAEQVWALVSDIHLMPRLSSELQEVEWLDGASAPRPGGRFIGRSAHPDLGTWETTSTVVECKAPQSFGWAVGDPDHPSSVWRFTLTRQGSGTALEQWAQMGPARSGLTFAIEAMPDKEQKIVFVRLREFETGMKANLAALKDLVEQEQ
ncbi:SRPBCC family protein [Streptomyces broussonetiae]|uniref:SRPBCC family protein n=1 Tax=Streptomyces broussonetiae TaxID=2686304 RepID=A0A6I6N7I7_9ACTN|nr:SRPBCC family protein [Streptomyces broussonetiae]QHA08903.1 SRPBCC family protein [Streptomyces broussonetiae]